MAVTFRQKYIVWRLLDKIAIKTYKTSHFSRAVCCQTERYTRHLSSLWRQQLWSNVSLRDKHLIKAFAIIFNDKFIMTITHHQIKCCNNNVLVGFLA
ncbi:hypothetical protein [Moraxella bovis]|uniref:hypothetical protein n=1 Tax=Moraxella bovis TaxID=476 RepID=UPI002227C3B3|nr:hypothetical protein [Moraxella bovis]